MTLKGVGSMARKKRYYLAYSENYLEENVDFKPTCSNEEAKICLNCPFPVCKQQHDGCKYYKSEIKRIKGLQNEERNKKSN